MMFDILAGYKLGFPDGGCLYGWIVKIKHHTHINVGHHSLGAMSMLHPKEENLNALPISSG